MEKISRGLSERIRKNSLNTVNVELDLDDLEHFLLHMSRYTDDPELTAVAREHFLGLAARFKSKDRIGLCPDELNEVVTMLSAFLSAAPDLPSPLVAQVHSYVGLIREKQNRHTCAIHSFLKALWLQTSMTDTQILNIAVTENRLGLAYGMGGNYSQAISLLEKALESYEKAKVRLDHLYIVNVQAALSDFRSRHLEETLLLGSRLTLSRRLGHINEEREYFSERSFSRPLL